MKHFLLIYHLAPDYLERRPAFREAHLALAGGCGARRAHPRRPLVPATQAVLLFAGEDSRAAERFAAGDPYVAEGLVERWEVRAWTTVVGEMAAVPIV